MNLKRRLIASGRRVRSLGHRPDFMEPFPHVGNGNGNGNGELKFFRDDVGYIGYLTDVEDSDGGVRRRRRDLLALDSDVGFSESVCLFVIVSFVVALFLFLFAASPWGVSPPSLRRVGR